MHRTILLSLLFVLSWITYLDRAAIATAKGPIASELSLSDASMGLVFGAFALGYAIAQVPAGWLADRFGARIVLAGVVFGWSIFTSLTGVVNALWLLIAVRFLFGIAEAGAFPGCAHVFHEWLPSSQHGRANGLIFAGSRLGAALAFPLLTGLMVTFGWRHSFLLLGLPGVVWALLWFWWFRDRETVRTTREADVPLLRIFRSPAMLLAMGQYFASNFTFFLCLSWMNPYLVEYYKLEPQRAGWYSMWILLFGATAQFGAGWLTDRLYNSKWRAHSRQIPAGLGFAISATGLFLLAGAESATTAVACFALAAFGAELTISPSWAYCLDIGGRKSGSVSGSMNMIGNFGSFVSASVFPLLVTAERGAAVYFLVAGALNVVAVLLWTRMSSERKLVPGTAMHLDVQTGSR